MCPRVCEHADASQVMDKLRVLFEGYSDTTEPPHMFVLMGNFTSKVHATREDLDRFRGGLPLPLPLPLSLL